jgi:ATP-binding cassette subfamily B protein
MDCGPTCLRIIAKHYGRSISLPKLRTLSETTREGSSLKNLATTAEKFGFRTLGVKITFKNLVEEAPLPCIVHWRQQHFVVVYAIKKKSSFLPSFLRKQESFQYENEIPVSASLHRNDEVTEKALSEGTPSPSERAGERIYVSDPAHGLLKYTQEEFIKNWIGNNADEHTEEGIVLLLEPTPKLKQVENVDFPNYKASSGLFT